MCIRALNSTTVCILLSSMHIIMHTTREERVLESRMILLQYFSTSRVRVLASTTVRARSTL